MFILLQLLFGNFFALQEYQLFVTVAKEEATGQGAIRV